MSPGKKPGADKPSSPDEVNLGDRVKTEDGFHGEVIRRNKNTVTIEVDGGGIVTTPYGQFESTDTPAPTKAEMDAAEAALGRESDAFFDYAKERRKGASHDEAMKKVKPSSGSNDRVPIRQLQPGDVVEGDGLRGRVMSIESGKVRTDAGVISPRPDGTISRLSSADQKKPEQDTAPNEVQKIADMVDRHQYEPARRAVRQMHEQGRVQFEPADTNNGGAARILIDGKPVGQASSLLVGWKRSEEAELEKRSRDDRYEASMVKRPLQPVYRAAVSQGLTHREAMTIVETPGVSMSNFHGYIRRLRNGEAPYTPKKQRITAEDRSDIVNLSVLAKARYEAARHSGKSHAEAKRIAVSGAAR